MNSVFVLVNTLVSVTVGAGLGSGLPFLIKRRDERNDSRVAKLRITTPLVGVMTALQQAYLSRQIDRGPLAVWIKQYVTVAREPEIIKHLSTSEIKWALRTAILFDVTSIQLESGKWEEIQGDPFKRSLIAPHLLEPIPLAGFCQSVHALFALGEGDIVRKNISADIVPAFNALKERMHGQMNQI